MTPLQDLPISPTSVAVALAALLISFIYHVLRNRGLPPGPTGLPYFGLWPYLDNKTIHLKLDEMKKRYGDVFCFTFTGRLIINLGTIDAVREAHVTNAESFADRWTDFNVMSKMFEHGVLYDSGESWKVQRKYFTQVLKKRFLKNATDTLNGPLYDVIRDTISQLRSANETAVNIIQLLTDNCLAIVKVSLFGADGLPDETIRDLVAEYEIMIAGMTPMNILTFGKFARFCLLPFQAEYLNAVKSHKKMTEMLFKIIDQRSSTYNEDHTRDLIDDYIKERNERKKKGDPTAKYFTDKALMGSLIQFVGDGVLSVSYFTSILIRFLVEYPEEQDKIYQEIVEVVGPERLPTVEDKTKLPYLNAFIQEGFRMSDFFSIFTALECKKETTLRGYRIPKGAITLMNSYSSHYDSECYEEPHKFNPSRFLNTAGKRRAELPILFGVGKRTCLGESFTVIQLFLFISAIIKNYHLTVPKNPDSSMFDLLVSGNLKIHAKPRTEK